MNDLTKPAEPCNRHELNGAGGVVAATSTMRETSPREYTFADAIDDVAWLRRTPDGLLSPVLQRRLIELLFSTIQASPCFFKGAKNGIPTFTLLAYDRAGHRALVEWIKQAEAHGCRPEKIADARAMLLAWSKRTDLAWPT